MFINVNKRLLKLHENNKKAFFGVSVVNVAIASFQVSGRWPVAHVAKNFTTTQSIELFKKSFIIFNSFICCVDLCRRILVRMYDMYTKCRYGLTTKGVFVNWLEQWLEGLSKYSKIFFYFQFIRFISPNIHIVDFWFE